MTELELSQHTAELEDRLAEQGLEFQKLKELQIRLIKALDEIKNSSMTKPGTRLIAERALRGVFIIERDLVES